MATPAPWTALERGRRVNMHDTSMRIVPHNIEAECALLGAILVNNAAFDYVAGFLEADHFHEPLHQKIYTVIEELIRSGRSVTPVTAKTFLPTDVKVGDMTVPQYLARLVSETVTVINAKDYGLAIHEMWIRRQAISACQDIADVAYDLAPHRDILAEIAPLEDRIASLRAERVKGGDRTTASRSYLESLASSFKRGEVRGVPIALAEIAEVISEPCFEAGNLYGLLSSSGEGKTSLTVQLIVHALKHGHPTCFLSYDQSSDQVMRQMVAQEHGIEARRQRDAKLLSEREYETCMDFAGWIAKLPFDVLKCTDQSAPQLVSMARTFVKRKGTGKIPLIVVDHIRAIRPENDRGDEGTKALRIGQILKSGAESTDAAWLVLNQRNSYGMKRDNPRPIAADLYGGEGAKAPFDAIVYLYRFLKFLEERKAIASSDSDWKKIEKVFPSAVRQDNEDIAELGAVKVRFGSPHIRRRLIFEAALTRYKSERPPVDQETMGGLF